MRKADKDHLTAARVRERQEKEEDSVHEDS